MNNDISRVAKGDVDLYAFLEVEFDASLQDIRRQYRKKALVYHPDKNPGSEDKFDLLSKAYEILSNEQLRSIYDEIRRAKEAKSARNESLNELTKKFRDELERAEKEYNFKNNIDVDDPEYLERRRKNYTVERLREEGLKKRRELEKSMLSSQATSQTQSCVYFDQLPQPQPTISLKVPNTREVVVKWKHKPELVKLFDESVLTEIMSIFGPIQSCSISTPSGSRYDTGRVAFEDEEGAKAAVNHDYSVSASLWDGTRVRKLASLLRACTYPEGDTKFNERDLEKLISRAVYNK